MRFLVLDADPAVRCFTVFAVDQIEPRGVTLQCVINRWAQVAYFLSP